MCGICGFGGFQDSKLLKKMAQVLAHRGPDDSGFYQDDQVSLGHRRLAIIDLSSGGHQPLLSEDKQKILVANGEIYNFKSLKEMLEKKGHKFFGQSDNEVILHGYEEWGIKVVNKLVGMFAFALWDKKKKILILARDHLGIKPLYYAHQKNCLIFASEAKAILVWENLKKELDFTSIDYYLSLRYVPGERTMFTGLKRLSPGSILIFRNGKIKISKYWQPKIKTKDLTGKKPEEKLKDLLSESVNLEVVSDVPLGTYLSGGLDSSVVTALAGQQTVSPLETFSLGFGSQIDETDKAKEVSRFLKTSHHQFKITQKDFGFLPKIVSFLDEPIGDPIILPIFLLAQNARKRVKVVLTGDGADEIFGGYIHHLGIYWKERLKKIFPVFLMSLGAKIIPSKIVDRIFPYPSSLGSKGKERLVDFLQAKTLSESFLEFASLFTNEEKNQLYSPFFLKRLKGQKSARQEIKEEFKNGQGDILQQLMVRDLKFWLPDYILLMADRLSMAHGLEARVPYLDHRLVEFTLCLPSILKIKGLVNKFLLRKAMNGFLPKKILNQPKKAFFLPVEQFAEIMEKLMVKILNQKTIKKRGFFNFEYIQRLKAEFKKSPLLVGKQLMALVILELWLQKFYDQKF